MLRTLLFSSFISSLFHCCRWSIQTKCKRKNFFLLYTQMLLISMCCPILKENSFEGGGCSLWSSYKSARNLMAFLLLSWVQTYHGVDSLFL